MKACCMDGRRDRALLFWSLVSQKEEGGEEKGGWTNGLVERKRRLTFGRLAQLLDHGKELAREVALQSCRNRC